MTHVLVINHVHSPVCGIHDLGCRIHDRLADGFAVAYAECNDAGAYRAACEEAAPDVMIINYRADLMPWVNPATIEYGLAPVLGVLHNYEPATVEARAHELLAVGFDHALVLDPTLASNDPRIQCVSRPLPVKIEYNERHLAGRGKARQGPARRGSAWHSETAGAPRVGSFGYAFGHKQFHLVAREIAETCTEATFALHMPEAYFNGAQGGPVYGADVLAAVGVEMTRPGLSIEHTAEHLPSPELAAYLAANDVNCLFYQPGQPDAGLSSALDYLLAARRPILVTDCAMFRHGAGAVAVWPDTRLDDVLAEAWKWQASVEALADQLDHGFAPSVERVLERVL